MKISFLGTSAGENYPAVWCHCPCCEYARQHGGRNIRLNSCVLLDDDALLDMNAKCFSAALQSGVFDYLLKTLESEQVDALMQRVCAKLSEPPAGPLSQKMIRRIIFRALWIEKPVFHPCIFFLLLLSRSSEAG